MVDNSSLRAKVAEATSGMWGKANPLKSHVSETFGKAKATAIGSSVYYDVEAFYANVAVSKGDHYIYKYNQFKSEMKPRRFQRFAAGVKLTEEQAQLDNDSLKQAVETAIYKQTQGLRTKLEESVVGYKTEDYLMSVLNGQATANSSIIDPADCNDTSGTAAALSAVNWTGDGQTERNIETVIGSAIRAIGAKVLDATTGESILKNDGSDTFDLWCHPSFAHILETSYDLLDSGEHDNLTYAKRLAQDWKVTIKPTMQIDAYARAIDETATLILTANTAENFKLVEVEAPTWLAWKEIDNGEVIEIVKRFKAGEGAVAVPYISGTQAYKAMYVAVSTPIGA